jgi:hypothetical protein
MTIKYNIEVPAEGLPAEFFRNAILIRDDSESTIREKWLADLLIQVGEAHNKLAKALDLGTATVVVEESGFRSGTVPKRS